MKKSFLIKPIDFTYLASKYSRELSKYDLKYSNGKCAFIGSNSYYTGGIYFSAMSSMRSGCDQAHIFAHNDSVQALKSYSPDLIVHNSFDNNFIKNENFYNFGLLDKFDSISIGTCLGKDDNAFSIVKYVIENIKNEKVIFIFDADSISFLNKITISDQIEKMKQIFIFTPNNSEYKSLLYFCLNNDNSKKKLADKIMNSFNSDQISLKLIDFLNDEFILRSLDRSNDNLIEIYKFFDDEYMNESILKLNLFEVFERYLKKEINRNILDLVLGAYLLSINFGKIFVIKGYIDIICFKENIILVKNQGSLKRCGGIGDILVGIMSGFITSMLKNDIYSYHNNSNNCNNTNNTNNTNNYNDFIINKLLDVLAISCYFCKDISSLTYKDKGKSMIASDIVSNIRSKF